MTPNTEQKDPPMKLKPSNARHIQSAPTLFLNLNKAIMRLSIHQRRSIAWHAAGKSQICRLVDKSRDP